MNNPNFIFNPYIQQFVPVHSENGQQIIYLEKICFECNYDSIYDQIQLKCIKKKNYKSIEKQQIELCKNYIDIKKKIAPIDKNILYKILNIKIFNKSISDLLDINSNNINLFNDKQTNIAIVSILAYIVNNHLQLSKIGILESIFQQIYKIFGNRQDILNFMFKVIENIINNYPKIISLPFKQLVLIFSKIFSLLNDTKYIFLYTFNNCIYFILGCIEYSTNKIFSKEISEKLMDGRVLDTIKLLFNKQNEVEQVILMTNKITEEPRDIFDTIPDWKYYNDFGVLYPMLEEKEITTKYKIEYHKKNILKIKEDVKINLESLRNFTKILTRSDIELLKKLGHIDENGKLYLERIGLSNLKDPSKQLLGLRYFENSGKDNSFYYIDNSGNERYKSIYATAQAPKINELLLKYFKNEIVPKYKIYSKELEILEGLLIRTIEYNKEKIRIDALIKGLEINIKEYNQKKQKIIKQLNQVKKDEDKIKIKEQLNINRKNIIEKLNDKKRIINKFKNSSLFLKIKENDGESIKKMQNELLQYKLLLKEEYLKKNNKNEKLIKEYTVKIKNLTKNIKNLLNKISIKPKIIDLDDKTEKELKYIINILKKQIENINDVIDNYSNVFSDNNDNIERLVNENKILFEKINLNTKDWKERYSKLLEKKDSNILQLNQKQIVNQVQKHVEKVEQNVSLYKKQIEKDSSQKQIKQFDINDVIFNQLLIENNMSI